MKTLRVKPKAKYIHIENNSSGFFIYFSNSKMSSKIITKERLDNECSLDEGIFCLELDKLFDLEVINE